MGTPSQFMREQADELAAQSAASFAVAQQRRTEKRRATLKAKAEKKAQHDAAMGVHIHPADDPWSITCRTLCGRVLKVKRVLSPKAGLLRLSGTPNMCPECIAILRAWKFSGNGKPLTFRRLNSWPGIRGEQNMDTRLTPRASALAAALSKTTPGSQVHTLLGELMVIEVDRSNFKPVPNPDGSGLNAEQLTDDANAREARFRKALAIELVKLPGGIPPEVLAELVKS